MADNKINVGGRLHSIATGNVLAGADEILYEPTNGTPKKQSEVNVDIDNALGDRYTKEQTYSKSELNNMITTPNQKYVSVTATAQTTAVTDLLPATGEADTVYRVGNWDGSQFDASVYSEYAWNGSQYIHLSTKTQIGEVFDISAYHATGGTLATYADLSAALDSNNGGGVPQSLQKGGMSIKFIQSSDNKYVQYFLIKDEWSASEGDWEKMNLEEEISQLGQEIGAEIITPYELVVSSSSQSKRIDFARAQKGRFKIAFDGGSSSGFACKVVLYKGSTAEQNLVLESERFGFNKWIGYSGNKFDIAIFTVYGGMVVTAGEANIIVELGISSDISSLEERIDAGEKSDFALMVKTHGYNLSGSPVLDENGLLVQSGVSWADGSAGTLRKTNFNEDVLEYAVVTVTHAASSKTIQYSYQFSELGEITKETINIL